MTLVRAFKSKYMSYLLMSLEGAPDITLKKDSTKKSPISGSHPYSSIQISFLNIELISKKQQFSIFVPGSHSISKIVDKQILDAQTTY